MTGGEVMIVLNRVAKPKSGRSSTERRHALLASLLPCSVDMPSCSYCESRGMKLWFEKIMRAVSRGIDDLEELDRVEREEAEQEERRRSTEVLPEVSLESLLPDSNFVWDSTFPMGPLNPSLLDEMNVLAQHSVGSSGGMVSSPGRPLTSGNDPTPDSIGGAVPGNPGGG
ncbi:hypothetical protein MGG_16573 [Pyricularia oryzae 70-15]|uniref:Uncharacterized protein n=1 Tax=Pyricularia oryzae (strain 70-15 / ATCC MYA-4617 / FGSC 8958) TaxID=242507 RepID=G4MLX1_PYRO7|nr:uncharacterized protein MGG_16573 [Pyricularia oryzae 70-15]EHA58538.1 hypothetical protein MGG_16573 [Pyricularia oryzae 70-15]